MSEVERYQPPDIANLNQWAEALYASGNFTDTQSVGQAFVKVAAGAELGLSPFQSMQGIHLIKGKPVVGAGLLAALLDRDPQYSYSVEWSPDEANPDACTIIVSKNGALRGTSTFSLEDARRAGILRDNWLKYPKAMLFARAMSQAVRWYAPGATGTTFYVEGELAADVEVSIPAGVTTKPRTRVTAEVIPPLPEPEEDIEGEVMPYALEPLRAQLTHLSRQEKADLWNYAGLSAGTKMADVKARLIAYADEIGVDYTEEPDARAILLVSRMAEHAALPADSAEAFQHFADTGQDLHEDPQARIA